MNKIANSLIGDTTEFTYAHRVFNFTLLVGILITFSRTMMVFLTQCIETNGFYCLLVVPVWVFLYYLSRVRKYFNLLSIISFIIIIVIFFPISWTIEYGSESFRYLDITINLIISTLFTAVLLIILTNKYNSEKKKVEKYARDIEKNYQRQSYFIKNIEELINKLKAERDGINYHLVAIYGLLEENDITTVIEYIKNDVNTDEYQDIVKIPYSVLRAMLNYKLLTAKEEKIELKLKIKIPEELELNQFDLCIITGYLLDNAIKDCCKLMENERYINLSIIYKSDYLVIQIVNPLVEKQKKGKQIITKLIEQYGERQITYKGDYQPNYNDSNQIQSNYQKNYKSGISDMKYLVNKYDGLMEKKNDNGVYKVNIALLMSGKNIEFSV